MIKQFFKREKELEPTGYYSLGETYLEREIHDLKRKFIKSVLLVGVLAL